MRNKVTLMSAVALLVLIAGTACSPSSSGTSVPEPASPSQAPVTPPAASQSANPTPQPAPTSSGNAGQPSGGAQLAPLCQAANACTAPSAEQHEIGCVDKVPYTNILVEPNTQFEVVDKSGDFSCADSGTTVAGKTVVTCHGKELLSFDLRLTGEACGGSPSAGSDQCQAGYGYDASQQCCAPLAGEASGSTTVRVDLGACPLPRPSAGG